MHKDKNIFGWKAVFDHYGLSELLKDSILPVTLSIILLIGTHFSSVSFFDLLSKLIDIGLTVVPAMVALILAAYTIMLAFIISDKMNAIKGSEEGGDLIKSLNAGFAACLFFSTISIILLVVVSYKSYCLFFRQFLYYFSNNNIIWSNC